MSTSATARRKARQKTTPQPETTPQLSCEVCHIPGTEETLENWGEYSPYWMCVVTETRECDKRAGIIRDVAITEDEAQGVEAAAEEPAEATT